MSVRYCPRCNARCHSGDSYYMCPECGYDWDENERDDDDYEEDPDDD
jgi:tRNA(Ile2) C34 agmatinyltransferase TiaS